jgi:ABC-type multidrug transport system fused ATPase/permease subunit
MLWQFFPVITLAALCGVMFCYLTWLCIEHLDSYSGITEAKKRRFVFWGLKILEFTALMFVIEMAVSLMTLGTAGGFFHTTAKIIFSVLISMVLLLLIVCAAWVFIVLCKGLGILVSKIRKDLIGDIKRILGNIVDSIAGIWNVFVQANRDYAEVIAKDGVFHSIVHVDMLKWEVAWMRRKKLEEEQERKKEAKERTERIRQLEKECNEPSKPTIKPLWYPLGDNDEI